MSRDRGVTGRLEKTTGGSPPEGAIGVPPAGRHFPVRALSRATNSEPIPGNRLTLQFEGGTTFESWLSAIAEATRFIHFENYLVRADATGRRFRDALIERARAGVKVHVLFDWMGSWATPARYWRSFREAGIEIRAFNRPAIRDPFRVLQRDHRKLVCVDGTVAFVGGFCVGDEWAGPGGDPPWRDTGVEIRGPAASAAAVTFERVWRSIGPPLSESLRSDAASAPFVGDAAVWVIQGQPWRSRTYRASQLIAASARERLWVTDPYFVAPRPVSEALAAAASDGVDVRILVPAHNNWPWVGSLSRGGYRFLLDAGVRIFEWQGPMIHAKTAVADGVWCRIGSSNLNAASLLGNWEIDVGVLDTDLAGQMEGLFVADLASSVEIVLPTRPPAPSLSRESGGFPLSPLEAEGTLHDRIEHWRTGPTGTRLRLTDVMRAGSALGDAIAGSRTLGREDRTVLGTVAIGLLLVGGAAAILPRVAGWALAAVMLWLGITIGVRAAAQARRARAERNVSSDSGVVKDDPPAGEEARGRLRRGAGPDAEEVGDGCDPPDPGGKRRETQEESVASRD